MTGRVIAKRAAITVTVLALLLGAVLVFLDTSAGHRLIANRIGAYSTASGMQFHVGAIDGSVYGKMTLRDVRVSDPAGVFLNSPEIRVDWRPFAYLSGLADLREVSAEQVRLLRLPSLRPTPTKDNAPLLPDIDLTLGRLHVGRLMVDPAVTGRRHVVSIDGNARIADRRAQIAMSITALRAPGIAGGDRLQVVLDAVPDENRLSFDVRLAAPVGGLVDSAFTLGQPLDFSASGRGSWMMWRGTARASVGASQIANLAITARDGTFGVRGALRPALVMRGPAARLAEPEIALDATALLEKRRVNLSASMRSSAVALDARGLLDLGENRFGGLRLDARLLTPGSVAPNLSGRQLQVTALLDGPFADPTIAYRATAAELAFGTTGVEDLRAKGRITIDGDRILISLHAVARRVSGLNAAAGGLLTNLRVDGHLAYADGKLISDGLKLRSDKINATAIIIADIASGIYTGALKGRVNDYQVDGLGRIALVTDARLTATANGYAIRGRIRVTTRRLDNASLAGALGGPAVITADVGYDPKTGATLRNLRLTSSRLRIDEGAGSWRGSDGRIAFRAVGRSTQYGVFSATVSGTTAKPLVRIKATRPTIGLPLSNVEAEIEGTGNGYRVRASGGSPYGPFAADLTLRTGAGPMRLDIARARFAGIDIAGSVIQSSAGPFLGTLSLKGEGLTGSARLSAAGRIQRVDLAVDAKAARIPANPPIVIGNGTLRATALLYPGQPSVTGDLRLANVAQGGLMLTRTRARLRYQNGSGSIALVANGRSSATFDLALQAAITPERIRANLRGSANGVAFRLAVPATISRSGSRWQLQPTRLLLPQGSVLIEGSYGAGLSLNAALRNVDLSLVEAFAPGYGLGGSASGRIALTMPAGASLPEVQARLDIARFTRTGTETVSTPVDIALSAQLGAGQGRLAAILRRGATVVGRLQARVGPIPAGASLTRRLLAAPLAGGMRYSGPAEVLWTLTGVSGQEVTGPIALAADFSGNLGDPSLRGVMRADALTYTNAAYGTKIRNIAVLGRFTQSQLTIAKLTGRAGDGSVSAAGSVGLDASRGFPINLQVTLDQAQLARSDELGATVSGTLRVTHDKSGGLIKGDLRIPEARYQVVRQRAAEVPVLTGVRRKNAPPTPPPPAALPSNWKLDIRLRAANRLYVSGMGLEAEWRANLRVRGSTSNPQLLGELNVVRGTYSFGGRRFEIDRGEIAFHGGPTVNPTLNIAASTTVETISAVINITGTAQRPQITFTSTPALPQDEVLSRLLFGQSVTSLSPLQAVQLAAALNSLRGSGGGLNPLGKLRSVAGIDRLRILGSDQAAGRGTAIAVGQHIGKNIYIEVITDARGFTATQLEIALSKALSILSQTSSFGGSNVTIRYKKEY